jgi:hypothetical protein
MLEAVAVQSFSASRFTVGAAGFLLLSQSGERPKDTDSRVERWSSSRASIRTRSRIFAIGRRRLIVAAAGLCITAFFHRSGGDLRRSCRIRSNHSNARPSGGPSARCPYATGSPSIRHERALKPQEASTMVGNRPVQSLPLRVSRRTPAGSRRTMTAVAQPRKPRRPRLTP